MTSPDVCPACGADSSVTETRPAPGAVRRRRLCMSIACSKRWTTYELCSVQQATPGHLFVAINRAQLGAIRQALSVLDRLIGDKPARTRKGAQASVDELTPSDDLDKAFAAEVA